MYLPGGHSLGDVLYFTGAVDAEGGPGRRLEGSLSTGLGRRVGDFVAEPL